MTRIPATERQTQNQDEGSVVLAVSAMEFFCLRWVMVSLVKAEGARGALTPHAL